MSQTFLTLAPEHGGIKFGPFMGGAIQFGSDRGLCQIALDPSTGAAPCHAVLTDQGNGSYVLAPVQRNYQVFALHKSTGRLSPIMNPTPMGPGDSIVIGSPQGPRFTIERTGAGHGQAYAAAGRPPGFPPGAGPRGGFGGGLPNHRGQPLGTALGKEAKRQAEVYFLTQIPGYRVAYQWWYRAKTGSLMHPRNIITLIVTLLGFIFVSGAACLSGLAALFAGVFN